MERKCQQNIIKHLKKRGFFVIKTRPGPGTPVGTPDILFFKEGFWGAIEVKGSLDAEWQPLQRERLRQFGKWSWARMACPENEEQIKLDIDELG